MQLVGDFLAPHAHDNAVGFCKVIDRGPFLEKLRITGNVAIAARQFTQADE